MRTCSNKLLLLECGFVRKVEYFLKKHVKAKKEDFVLNKDVFRKLVLEKIDIEIENSYNI